MLKLPLNLLLKLLESLNGRLVNVIMDNPINPNSPLIAIINESDLNCLNNSYLYLIHKDTLDVLDIYSITDYYVHRINYVHPEYQYGHITLLNRNDYTLTYISIEQINNSYSFLLRASNIKSRIW